MFYTWSKSDCRKDKLKEEKTVLNESESFFDLVTAEPCPIFCLILVLLSLFRYLSDLLLVWLLITSRLLTISNCARLWSSSPDSKGKIDPAFNTDFNFKFPGLDTTSIFKLRVEAWWDLICIIPTWWKPEESCRDIGGVDKSTTNDLNFLGGSSYPLLKLKPWDGLPIELPFPMNKARLLLGVMSCWGWL